MGWKKFKVMPKIFSEKIEATIKIAPDDEWFKIDMEDKSLEVTRAVIFYVMKRDGVRRGFRKLKTKFREGELYAMFVPSGD